MFLYLNFRKNAGLVGHQAFHKEEKVAPYILEEIRQLISSTKNDHGGGRNCPDSKEVDTFLAGLYRPTIPQLRELIQKYEAWAAPFSGPALLHDIQEHALVKDVH